MSYREIVEEFGEVFADAMTEQEYNQFVQSVTDNRLALDENEWYGEQIEDNWKYESMY